MTRAERLAAGSLVLGCLVLGLKIAAWGLTHSAAFFSDALESTVNVAASVIALAALRFAARPADDNHPYGHTKAEFFAAVIEGVLIVVASLAIFREALTAFLAPVPLGALPLGIALNGAATVANRGVVVVAAAGGAEAALAGAGGGWAASAGRCRDLGRDRRGGGAGGADRGARARPRVGGGDGGVCAVVGDGDDRRLGGRADGCGAGRIGAAAHPRTGGGERGGRDRGA